MIPQTYDVNIPGYACEQRTYSQSTCPQLNTTLIALLTSRRGPFVVQLPTTVGGITMLQILWIIANIARQS